MTILSAALVLRLLDFNDRWSWTVPDYKNAHGGFHTGALAGNFARHGFVESGFMPYYYRLKFADSGSHYDYYFHHPALYQVLSGASLRLFGHEEWALRLPAVLFSVFSLAALALLVREIWGWSVAAVAAATYAVVPLAAHYGSQTCYECANIGLQCLALRHYVLWLRSGRRRQLLFGASCVLAGGLFDWQMSLALPGILIHALVTALRRGDRKLFFGALVLPAAALLAAALHLGHVLLVIPAPRFHAELSWTLGYALPHYLPLAEFLSRQGAYLVTFATWPVLVLAGLGALQQLRWILCRQVTTETSILFVMLLTGILNVAVFAGRSSDHDYYLMLGLPYLCTTVALVVVGATRSAQRHPPRALAPLAAGLLVAGTCIARDVELWASLRSDEVCEALEHPILGPALGDEHAVIVTNSGRGMILPFYSHAAIIYAVNGWSDLIDHVERTLRRLPRGSPVFFLLDTRSLAAPEPMRRMLGLVATPRAWNGFAIYELTSVIDRLRK